MTNYAPPNTSTAIPATKALWAKLRSEITTQFAVRSEITDIEDPGLSIKRTPIQVHSETYTHADISGVPTENMKVMLEWLMDNPWKIYCGSGSSAVIYVTPSEIYACDRSTWSTSKLSKISEFENCLY